MRTFIPKRLDEVADFESDIIKVQSGDTKDVCKLIYCIMYF